MSLLRLSERFPALLSGFGSPRTPFGEYAGKLHSELTLLKRDPVGFRIDEGLCPLDILALFRPARRMAVLNGSAEYADWQYAAAVRLTALYANSGRIRSVRDFDRWIAGWTGHPLLRTADGPPAWIRKVFSDETAGPEDELLKKTVWNGITVDHFLNAGSTSQVYCAEYRGKNCVLKVPKPGNEARFRQELAVLRSLHHPNLPELLCVFEDSAPGAVLEFYHTGKYVKTHGENSGFIRALKHLHASGLLHGDIRLANLGIRTDGSAVLLDFSHARKAVSARETEMELEKMKCLLQA